MTDQTQAQFDAEAADYAAMGINPAAEIAAMTTPASVTAPVSPAAAYDARLIAEARTLASAVTRNEIRGILATLPGYQHSWEFLSDSALYAAAFGTLAAYTKELATSLEREVNRNA